ncbi:MAG: tRNA lysidine(34) synthetase TilS [Pseudomonadota bacterium]
MTSTLVPKTVFKHVGSQLPVIVAVSGGSDSIALLNLAASWANAVDADLRVVTVDHGLRPEAAAEAAFVAGVCEGLGIRHFTLAWEGLKPTSGISQAARHARYLLMEEFANDVGAEEILVGHTSDDQAETIWMRNSRDGGSPQWRGLSGMAELMQLPSGVRVRRPLLNLGRTTLREYLKEIGQPWIEDPSNVDVSFERVRARQNLERSSIPKQSIVRLGELAGRQRAMAARTVCELLTDKLCVKNGPVFSVNHGFFENLPENVAVLAAQILVALAGGREHFIPHDVAKKIIEMRNGDRLTAGYSIVELRGTCVRLYRENRNLAAMHVPPYSHVIWDNRLMIENNTSHSYMCSAMDRGRLKLLEKELDTQIDVKPRVALQSVAAVTGEDGSHYLPFVKGTAEKPGLTFTYKVPAVENFCSQHDFALLEIVQYIRDQMGSVQKSRGLKD